MKKSFAHLKGKILVCILLLVPLLTTIAVVHIGVASDDETKLYVDPPSIIDSTLLPPAHFSITIKVANVTDLYSFEFKLRYGTTILTGLGVITVPFPNQTNFTSNTSIDDEKGIVFVNVTYRSPAEPLTTTDPVTLARIFFLVEAVGATNLDLYDAKLVDDKAVLIDHSLEDGYFSNLLRFPVALFTYSPVFPSVNEAVTFNASGSYDPDDTIVSYFWDFGDDTNATGMIVDHTYVATGVYTVNLTVTDSGGLTNSTAKSISIVDGNPPTIGVPSRTPPGDIQPDQAVKVLVNVTDAESGVENVTLSYTTNNGVSWTGVEMIYNTTSSLYEAMIPGQPVGTYVLYKIIAYDKVGNPAVEDNAGSYYVYTVIPEFSSFIILPLFMVMALAAVILGKAAWSRKRSSLPVAE